MHEYNKIFKYIANNTSCMVSINEIVNYLNAQKGKKIISVDDVPLKNREGPKHESLWTI